MRQDVGGMPEGSLLELVRRASTHGDQEAWAAFEQGVQETVLSWLRAYPGRAMVWDERHIVARAFEQVWQVVHQGQFAYRSFSEVLLLLRASLGGAMLEAQRVSLYPSVVGEGMADVLEREGHTFSAEIWEWVQDKLTDERERRLAYLLYHCGLQPSDIVRCCPQEWSDVQEVMHLRCSIFVQLLR